MPREVDPKRTRKALKIIRQLAEAPKGEGYEGDEYSGWEQEFLGEVEARLEKFGSAFADPSKGRPEEALSQLQAQKLKEIAAKARGGAKTGKNSAWGKSPPDAPPREGKLRGGLSRGGGFKRKVRPAENPEE